MRVLIIGGYGNFGGCIARMLAQEPHITLILAGRDRAKAEAFAASLPAGARAECAALDMNGDLDLAFAALRPAVVIHTSGPFQGQDYRTAEACLRLKAHYIDLADARAFVTGIDALDSLAKAAGVLICGGASSVPCLTAAVIDRYKNEFAVLESVEYAIATAHLTNRGLATVRAVLSYAGAPFETLIDGRTRAVRGWLGLTARRFWRMNLRLLGDADVPDLALFPKRYPTLKTLRFRAGLELKILHLALTALSGLRSLRLLPPLAPLAPWLLRISYLFDRFGKDDSGFYMTLSGKDAAGRPKRVRFDLTARAGDGLYIPAVPAVILTRKLASGALKQTGAGPCLDLITLEEYLAALQDFKIEWRTEGA